MCSVVDYLHSKGVVHRDIKPENIMYNHPYGNDDVNFFLGDFGLSMTEAAIKQTVPGGGTPFYNAPEIEDTGTPTPASDIWALGVTLCQVRGYWCCAESARSPNFWDRKLASHGCPNANYMDPPGLRDEADIWPHRVLTFAQHAVIPATLARMMSKVMAERPTAAELRRIPIAHFTESPRESAAVRAATKAAAGTMGQLPGASMYGQQSLPPLANRRPAPAGPAPNPPRLNINAYGQQPPQPPVISRPAVGPSLGPLRPSKGMYQPPPPNLIPANARAVAGPPVGQMRPPTGNNLYTHQRPQSSAAANLRPGPGSTPRSFERVAEPLAGTRGARQEPALPTGYYSSSGRRVQTNGGERR
jgi:serine/threonine protein kinase